MDNLLEGLVRGGVRAVRLGRPDRIRPELMRFCVDVPPPGRTEVNWSEKITAIRTAQARPPVGSWPRLQPPAET